MIHIKFKSFISESKSVDFRDFATNFEKKIQRKLLSSNDFDIIECLRTVVQQDQDLDRKLQRRMRALPLCRHKTDEECQYEIVTQKIVATDPVPRFFPKCFSETPGVRWRMIALQDIIFYVCFYLHVLSSCLYTGDVLETIGKHVWNLIDLF